MKTKLKCAPVFLQLIAYRERDRLRSGRLVGAPRHSPLMFWRHHAGERAGGEFPPAQFNRPSVTSL